VLTLTDAKAQAKRLLAGALLAKNDPTPVAMTVKAAIEKFETLHLVSRSDAYRRSWATIRKRHLPAKLLASDLNSVTRRDWIALSDPLTRAGKKGMARFVSSTIRAFLSFCVDRGYLDAHPLAGVRRVAPPPPRTRVLSELELQVIWQAANSLSRVDALVVKALMITACRRSEILELTCSEYDVGKGVIALNAKRVKNRHEHELTLPKRLRGLMGELDAVMPKRRLFFGGALHGTKLTQELRERTGIGDLRLHDLRRSAATHMARIGIPPHVIELVLNHRGKDLSGVAAIYNRWTYGAEKADALQRWENELMRICVPLKVVSDARG
jgi:integrase